MNSKLSISDIRKVVIDGYDPKSDRLSELGIEAEVLAEDLMDISDAARIDGDPDLIRKVKLKDLRDADSVMDGGGYVIKRGYTSVRDIIDLVRRGFKIER